MLLGFLYPNFAQTPDSLSPVIIDPSPVLVTDTAQDQTPRAVVEPANNSTERIITSFAKEQIELNKGEIVSNVLKVYNNTDETISFALKVLFPAEWKIIGIRENYQIPPRDTLFSPITLIPRKMINDNAEIQINTFILDENQKQIASDYFTIKTIKKVSWSVSASPTDKFYFKNGETSKRFDLNIINTGNGKQDIFVSQRILKENLIIYDTNENILKDPNYTLSLNSREDTTLSYIASLKYDRRRNQRRISPNSYTPSFDQTFEQYNLFVNTSEPNTFDKNAFRKSNRVSFIKLPNQDKMADFGYANLPLIVEANAQNILSDATFMSLNMRGFKQLNEDASLVYFAQLNYTSSFYSNTVFQNSPWYIGYFDKENTVEVGQLSSNMIGINGVGKGVRLSHRFNEQHKTSAFWIRSPGYFQDRRSESVGLSHTFRYNNNFRITGNYGYQTNLQRNVDINSISIQPSFNINQRHYFNVLAATTIRLDNRVPGSSTNEQGYLISGSYSTRFLDKRLRTSLNGRYNDRNFAFGTVQRTGFNHRSIYDINERWDVFLANNYQRTENFSSVDRSTLFEQELLTNNLIFSSSTPKGAIQPGLYFDYRNTRFNEIYLRGLSMRYSSFSFSNNYLGSFNFRAGYSLPLGALEEERRRDYFTFQFNSLIRYKVWNFNARYNYGVFSIGSAQNFQNTGVTPQDLRLAIQNQYQFTNKHFILESNIIYNYNNAFNGHNLGAFPEFFYYTNSGWRFSLRLNYNFSTRKFRPVPTSETVPIAVFDEPERTYNNDVIVGATIRKEFGIPIPFVERTSADIEFVAFFDIDGDGIQGNDEPAIENVIIQLDQKEILTNEEGKANLKNVPKGFHPINAISLEDLNGWFPNVGDSIFIINKGTQYVPFTRGVKVYGDVILDRQEIGVADTSKPFDLSRIKITASNGKVYNTLTNLKGRFEFYLPNGDYEITMDESILGSRYTLTQNNLPVTLRESQDGVYVSFFIVEKRRRVVRKRFGN